MSSSVFWTMLCFLYFETFVIVWTFTVTISCHAQGVMEQCETTKDLKPRFTDHLECSELKTFGIQTNRRGQQPCRNIASMGKLRASRAQFGCHSLCLFMFVYELLALYIIILVTILVMILVMILFIILVMIWVMIFICGLL